MALLAYGMSSDTERGCAPRPAATGPVRSPDRPGPGPERAESPAGPPGAIGVTQRYRRVRDPLPVTRSRFARIRDRARRDRYAEVRPGQGPAPARRVRRRGDPARPDRPESALRGAQGDRLPAGQRARALGP